MTNIAAFDAFLAQTARRIRRNESAPWRSDLDHDLQSLWSRIEYHGISILLHKSLSQLANWPDGLIARIAQEARLIGLWETTHQAAVSKLLAKLEEGGIGSVLLKGTALAYSLHKDPASRRRGDSDLLIHPSDLERARSILTALGWYRKDDPHGLYFQEGWLFESAGQLVHFVDLHWEPSDRPVLHRLLPFEECFSSRVALPAFSDCAYRPSLAMMIIHATINQKWHSRHGYYAEDGRIKDARRLIWSIDFDLMVNKMDDGDWSWLIDHCRNLRAGPLVAEALRGAQADLCTDFPEDKLVQLESYPLNPDYETTFSNADTLTQFWLDFRRASSWQLRWRLIWHRGLPPRAHLIARYPQFKSWPTALLQGKLLLDTAARLARRVVPK